MFSVVIPLYNKELSVKDTIQSVLDQTFTDFEIIIVNDGSTDNSLQLILEFTDPRIRIVDKTNGGVSSARNRGIAEARYEWIAFLDGDDIWKKNHLEVVHNMIIRYPEDNVFCTSFIRSNQQLPARLDADIQVIEDYFKEAIKDHFYWTSATCINCSVFELVGNFNERYNRGEDLDLWARIGRKYRFIKSNKVTAIYRIEAENRSDRSFILEKSRVFNYDFKDSKSESETRYFKKQIVKSLIMLFKKRDFRNFFKLKKKHRVTISYMDILNSFIR